MGKKKYIVFFGFILVVLLAGVSFKKSSKEKAPDTQTSQNDESTPAITQESKVQSENTIDIKSFNEHIAKAQQLFIQGDYKNSIVEYDKALNIQKSEHAYSGKYFAQLALGSYIEAEKSLLSAISQNGKSSDYWSWYMILLQEKLGASKTKLADVYQQAYKNVSFENRINIVTQYARILEKMNDFSGAISQWQKAITINPLKKDIYQLEIDQLKGKTQ